MSKLIKAVLPWPWTLRESGAPPDYSYSLIDALGSEICLFAGPDARAKAEAMMVLGAEINVKKLKFK